MPTEPTKPLSVSQWLRDAERHAERKAIAVQVALAMIKDLRGLKYDEIPARAIRMTDALLSGLQNQDQDQPQNK